MTPAIAAPVVSALHLSINGQEYRVDRVAREDLPAGVRRAWTLIRTDRKGREFSYTIRFGSGPTTCSCADATYHSSKRSECKHLVAARRHLI